MLNLATVSYSRKGPIVCITTRSILLQRDCNVQDRVATIQQNWPYIVLVQHTRSSSSPRDYGVVFVAKIHHEPDFRS